MKVSFVTPTYNRAALLVETIDSILDSADCVPGLEYELIIIDDASTDNTEDVLRKRYIKLFQSGRVLYKRLKSNVGVTGAKNIGAKKASGEWIVFIDSDDLIIKRSFVKMVEIMNEKIDYDVIFFSCLDFDGARIGREFDSHELTLEDYIKHGTYGEKLPVVKRSVMKLYPYNSQLRGFESLSYFKILFDDRKVWLSDCACRMYRTDNLDRISGRTNQIKRSRMLAEGYFELIRVFGKNSRFVPVSILFKAISYKIISFFL